MHFVRRLFTTIFPVLAILALWTLPVQAASIRVVTTTPKAKTPICVIHSNPSIVESGFGVATESSIADIITVECQPKFSQQTVTIDATQLFNQCQGRLRWTVPFPRVLTANIPQFTVTLDNDGNATAALFGGPSCASGKAQILASLNAPPFTTASTTFTVLPPRNTKHGVTANPSTEVEDAVFSSVATVIQVEFPSVQAGKIVTIKSNELFGRCPFVPGAIVPPAASSLAWVGPNVVNPNVAAVIPTRVNTPFANVRLDNNGNAFVVVLGANCASGTSTITAELATVPYTTFVGHFTVNSPRPTV